MSEIKQTVVGGVVRKLNWSSFNTTTGVLRWRAISPAGKVYYANMNGWWFLLEEIHPYDSLEASQAAAQAHYEAGIAASIIPNEVNEPRPDGGVPAAIADLTFAVQHNPNCPSPWLVRLPGPKSAIIDHKPYSGFGLPREELTDDILGFGKTFAEAADAACAAAASAKPGWGVK